MREPKLWLRKSSKTWYVNLNDRQIPLGRNEAKAREQYHGLLADRQPITTETTVESLLGQFLEPPHQNPWVNFGSGRFPS